MMSLMFVLMVVLGACSQAATETKEETPKASAEKTQETAESTEEKVPKVAFVYIGVPSDGGWTKTHDEGREQVDLKFGIKCQCLDMRMYKREDIENLIRLV